MGTWMSLWARPQTLGSGAWQGSRITLAELGWFADPRHTGQHDRAQAMHTLKAGNPTTVATGRDAPPPASRVALSAQTLQTRIQKQVSDTNAHVQSLGQGSGAIAHQNKKVPIFRKFYELAHTTLPLRPGEVRATYYVPCPLFYVCKFCPVQHFHYVGVTARSAVMH